MTHRKNRKASGQLTGARRSAGAALEGTPSLTSCDGPLFTKGKLSPGHQGEAVRQLQYYLRAWDFYDGSLSGVFDGATSDALYAYQQEAGLVANGIADEVTKDYLCEAVQLWKDTGCPIDIAAIIERVGVESIFCLQYSEYCTDGAPDPSKYYCVTHDVAEPEDYKSPGGSGNGNGNGNANRRGGGAQRAGFSGATPWILAAAGAGLFYTYIND
jgi:hypothetical protein